MNELDQLRNNKKNQILFLNSTKVVGTQSCAFQHNLPYAKYRYLGMDKVPYIYDASRAASLTISKYLWDQDMIWGLTGQSPINGLLLESNGLNTDNIGFTSGYLKSYSFDMGLGRIPEINATIDVYGDYGNIVGNEDSISNDITLISNTPPGNYISLGAVTKLVGSNGFTALSGYDLSVSVKENDFITINGPLETYTGYAINIFPGTLILAGEGTPNIAETSYAYKQEDYKTIGPGSLSTNILGPDANRINSIGFDVNFDFIPIYSLGAIFPDTVLLNKAAEVNVRIEYETRNYIPQKTINYPNSGYSQNINITLSDYIGNVAIQSYDFPNMKLISEDYTVGTDQNAKVNLVFSNYIL